jgi:hypothetical protein
MTCRCASMAICFTGLVMLSVPGAATPIAKCNASFTACDIPENILLQLPFAAIAGDVVVTDPMSVIVSDVFRIFDNIVNTGAGTGLGNMAFLYSSDDSTPLPAPSTYSANVKFIPESPSGITPYLGNGTTYQLAAPEPRTLGLFVLGVAAVAILARRRRGTCPGGL